MATKKPASPFDDRALTHEPKDAIPKPVINIIVDGNSIYKPGMKTVFIEDEKTASDVDGQGVVGGQYCICNTVATTTTVPTYGSVCNCDPVCTCENVDSCPYNTVTTPGPSTGGGCSCQSVSCGGPCSCVPVH